MLLFGLGLGQGAGQALLQAVETLGGAGVDGGDGLAGSPSGGNVGGDDEVNLLLDVVEGEHLIEEHQARIGD